MRNPKLRVKEKKVRGCKPGLNIDRRGEGKKGNESL